LGTWARATQDNRMSFELAFGLWTVVTLLAAGSAMYLIVALAPDLHGGWRVLLRGGPR